MIQGFARLSVLLMVVLTFTISSTMARYSKNDVAEKLFAEAYALQKKSLWRKAISKYREAVKQDPKMVASNINMALCYNAIGEAQYAIQAANDALTYNSHSAYAWYHKGAGYQTLQQHKKAIQCFDAAIKSLPDNASYYLHRGTSYEALGMKAEANKDFHRALKLKGKTAQDNYDKAGAYYGLGKYKNAIPIFTEAIEQDPDMVSALHDRGLCYATTGQYKKAIKDYSACLKKSPSFYHCYYLRGAAYLMNGDYALAFKDFQKHLKISRWKGAHAPYSVMMGSIALRKSDQAETAQTLLDKAVKQFSAADWPGPVISYLAGKSSSEQLLKAAGSNVDRQTEARTYLGLNLSASGKKPKAVTELKWVQSKGNKKFSEYRLAISELSRLTKSQ